MKFTTIFPHKPRANPQFPRVRIGVFDANRLVWKQLALEWLRQMEAEKFECTQDHTLNITGGAQARFIIFVCEQVTSLTSTLPPKIYFDHFEVPFEYGHAIMANCGPPVSIKIHDHFWGRIEGGDIPHFEDLVLPLVHKLISRFGKEGAWAS